MEPLLFVILLYVFYGLLVILMTKRILGWEWGLAIIGLGIAFLAGIDWRTFTAIVTTGSLRVGPTIVTFWFGCVFGRTIMDTGIAETIIKKAVELGGGRKFVTVLLIFFASAYIFLGVVSVPGAIAVGVISLPIMMAIGISPMMASVFHTLAMAAIAPTWAYSWATITIVTKVPLQEASAWIFPSVGIFFVVALIAIVVEFKREGLPILGGKGLVQTDGGKPIAAVKASTKRVPLYALITPGIPVILIFLFSWDAVPAFLVSFPIAILLTHPGSGRTVKDTANLFTTVFHKGIADSVPIIIMQIGLGWIYSACDLPQVINPLKAVMGPILPMDKLGFFALAVVSQLLSKYRGPFNQTGMGAALWPAFMAANRVPPIALATVMAANGVSSQAWDPTWAPVVWTSNFCKVDTIRVCISKRGTVLWGLIAGILQVGLLTMLYIP